MTLFDPDALGGPDDPPSRDPEQPADASPPRDAPPPPDAPPTDPARRRLTPDQEAAVRERSRSLLLSASAGSGKTSVLVERFVRAVLDDGVDPSRILAITFTDKAAGELRERIRSTLQEIATPGARAAARATEGAFVSTIHGFCARLLRAHPLAAGLDPAFSVLDEPRAARLRDEAFAAALRAFLAGPHARDALDLVAAYRTDSLAFAIPVVHDELRSRGASHPRLPRPPRRPAPDAERTALAAARTALAVELESARDSKLVGDAREALDRCARFLEDVEAGIVPWPGRFAALDVACGRAAALDTEACHAYVEARDAYERACADHHAVRHIELLDELLDAYGTEYAERKAARGALDFDDLELRARDLLRERPAIRSAWRDRFALLMVDEFQDTNRRQLEVLEALEDDDLFCVGDEFQSIYGFRHADVAIFRERRDALSERGLALRLQESFRSVPAILAAVNTAFAGRFGEAFAPLRPFAPAAETTTPAVDLLVTDARGWDADEIDLGDTLPPGPAWRRAEARLLAQRLRELVDSGEAAPGEIAVLVRAAASMPVVERALADAGLPTLASAGRGFWTRQEVVDLMGYLAALANPLDERALLTVLASPLCGLSSDAIALLGAAAREQRTSVWAVLGAQAPRDPAPASGEPDGPGPVRRPELPPADAERLDVLLARFAAQRAAAPRLALDEVLDRAIAEAGYDTWVLGLVGGPRRLANIDKLLRLARGFEAAEGRDLRRFVDHATALEQAQKREPEAPVEDPDVDAVRLMTVHAAKGLEFAVVAIADLGRRPPITPPVLLVDGERVGVRLNLLDGARATPALDYPALETERRARDAAEEERILYVALTRAKRRLVLSGSVERWSNGVGAAPLTWLGPALVEDLPERFAAVAEGDADAAHATVRRDGFDVALTISASSVLGRALRAEWAAPQAAGAGAGAETEAEAASDLPGAGAGAGSDLPGAGAASDLPGAGAAAGARGQRVAGEHTPPGVRGERPPAPAPAPAAAPPAGALSYTALADYERCGYRFYAQRVLGLPDQPAPPGVAAWAAPARSPGATPAADPAARGRLDARVRGVIVHALLEEAGAPSADRVRALAAREGASVAERDVDAVRDLVAAFASSPTGRRLAAARRVRREHEFSFELDAPGRPLMVGVVDALGVEADGAWLVVDVKTDHVEAGADLEAIVDAQYGIQRALYALAALSAEAPRVEVVHLFLEAPGSAPAAAYGPGDVPRLTARIARLAAPLAAGDYPLTERPHASLCGTCPARESLCPYPRELTLRFEAEPPVSAPPSA
ncbi:UvrD-helicase domain-containing protein [Capillimicrobium parvum]|uniref:DNA 3'-5' helicase n=1 Tax=Capillimicrobium parvum TaxID=2884022 RepID=A0A9E6Y0S5_9ACTN|nr:UvrD-helicase domain-containing protein [Capillimicrobium parvum]UGS37840.1 ATP-dependent helicase/nuclease subunit A [Capillimicrobium parvum]